MAFLDFNFDLSQAVVQLKRIADALDRLNPPPTLAADSSSFRKRGPESLVSYGDNQTLWAREEFANLVHPMGLSPAQEQEIIESALAAAKESDSWQDEG